VAYNTAQNSCNNLPSYHSSHDKGLGISPFDTNGDIPLHTKLQLFATTLRPDNCASQGMMTRHNVVNR